MLEREEEKKETVDLILFFVFVFFLFDATINNFATVLFNRLDVSWWIAFFLYARENP